MPGEVGAFDGSSSGARSFEGRADRSDTTAQDKYAVDRDCRWKFTIAGHNRTIPLPQQVALVNNFHYMAFIGEIDLRNPLLEVGLFEEYTSDPLRGAKVREKRKEKGMDPSKKGKEKAFEEGDPEDTGGLRSVWMGRKVRLELRYSSSSSADLPNLPLPASRRSATRRDT